MSSEKMQQVHYKQVQEMLSKFENWKHNRKDNKESQDIGNWKHESHEINKWQKGQTKGWPL